MIGGAGMVDGGGVGIPTHKIRDTGERKGSAGESVPGGLGVGRVGG